MKTIFHALEEKILQRFIETKKELLEIASGMSANERREGRKEIMEAAVLYEVPADLQNPSDLYSIDGDSDAVIPIQGKLTPQADICDGFFSDCTTYGFIQTATEAADEDPAVREIKYHISSGGGYVEGVDATGQIIAACSKKTTAIVSGMAASAAYWLACQCDLIVMTAPTDFVGSIGVAVEAIDTKQREEAAGIKRIVLTSTDAPDKRIDIATGEGQKKMIEELDAIHEVFASRVAGGRNVTIEKINNDFGKGGIVIASQAKKVGMVDVIINEISSSPKKPGIESVNKDGNNKPPAAAGKPKEEASKMNLKELLAANPEANAEHDVLIASAEETGRVKGETAGIEKGKDEMKATIAAASPYLANEAYPTLGAMALKVITGEETAATLTVSVTAIDALTEQNAAALAKSEAAGETAPAAPDADKTQENYQAKKDRLEEA